MPHEQSIDFAVKFQESLITISNENKEINATLHNINRKNKWPSRWTRTSYFLHFIFSKRDVNIDEFDIEHVTDLALLI